MSIDKIKEAIEKVKYNCDMPNFVAEPSLHKDLLDSPTRVIVAMAEHMIEQNQYKSRVEEISKIIYDNAEGIYSDAIHMTKEQAEEIFEKITGLCTVITEE